MSPSPDETEAATETTSLLFLPSAGSTDRPSSSSSGGGSSWCNHHQDDDDVDDPRKEANNKLKLKKLALLFLVAAVATAAVWYTRQAGRYLYRRWSDNKEHNKHDDDATHHHTTHGGVDYDRPLSFLDPVADLGLPSYDRPTDSSPPRTLTLVATTKSKKKEDKNNKSDDGDNKKKKKSDSDDDDKSSSSNSNSNNNKAYPTNAWYQNMLLVDEGDEPNEMRNRAYAIPYVVDASGPVPGLRLHYNHIGATSDVVQVFLQESFGLTVGAAEPLSPSSSSVPAIVPAASSASGGVSKEGGDDDGYGHGDGHSGSSSSSSHGSGNAKNHANEGTDSSHGTSSSTTTTPTNSSSDVNNNANATATANATVTRTRFLKAIRKNRTTASEEAAAPSSSSASSNANATTNTTIPATTTTTQNLTNRYTVPHYTNLGFTMEWDAAVAKKGSKNSKMSSTVTKGMPYGTVIYEDVEVYNPENDGEKGSADDDDNLLPTIASQIPLRWEPVVDGGGGGHSGSSNNITNATDTDPAIVRLKCGGDSKPTLVRREIEMLFDASDFTWLVFFSEPVYVRCAGAPDGGVRIQVVGRAASVAASGETAAEEEELEKEPKEYYPKETKRKLVVRAALHKSCSSGRGSPLYCHQEQIHPTALLLGQGEYGKLLRESAHLYPGSNPKFSYKIVSAGGSLSDEDFDDAHSADKIQMTFDWDVQEFEAAPRSTSPPIFVNASTNETTIRATPELLTYALPHHIDMLEDWVGISTFESQIYCAASLMGPACLMKGSAWRLVDEVPDVRLQAARPPAPYAVPALAESLRDDLKFTLPRYYRQGAGDTYFSGKQLAKLGRILLVAEELANICTNAQGPGPGDDNTGGGNTSLKRSKKLIPENEVNKIISVTHEVGAWNASRLDYRQACEAASAATSLPSQREVNRAVAELRKSVEVWLNGKAVTPFVYDSAWGGVVSCGCNFEKSNCLNRFPQCPGFTDPGMNFGNAFYNDNHFHYGYHIYAAAVVAHFDPDWGKRFFERVLLLIRNIANPSEDDPHFPTWRHKDWYQGHSWASGISRPAYPNGKNQESSSEAVAAYEAIALYGQVMADNALSEDDAVMLRAANEVRAVGQVMTASELRSTRKYWHVTRSPDEVIKIYPSNYKLRVIGMVWQMMAQFQTWFGKDPYLVYGIQLLPLTPIAEQRDGLVWTKQVYKGFADSCEATEACSETGWSVLQMAVLASVGHQQEALDRVIRMNTTNFDGPAGDGHSRSNTLWYIATRPAVESPLSLTDNNATEFANATSSSNSTASANATQSSGTLTCNRPETCTDYALDTVAGLYTCRQRIQWLMQRMGKSMEDACIRVAVADHPNECGACDPNAPPPGSSSGSAHGHHHSNSCPPCTPDECASDFNRCPRYERTFVCTKGSSAGGCAPVPWRVGVESSWQCRKCCELSSCPMETDPAQMSQPGKEVDNIAIGDQKDCPPCSKDVCQNRVNQCPTNGAAPFLCYEGMTAGGCSPEPWLVNGPQCKKCCTVSSGCTRGHSHVRA